MTSVKIGRLRAAREHAIAAVHSTTRQPEAARRQLIRQTPTCSTRHACGSGADDVVADIGRARPVGRFGAPSIDVMRNSATVISRSSSTSRRSSRAERARVEREVRRRLAVGLDLDS